ncbi:serine/threonine-protein kinase [Flavonifractor plautii]|jgi:serine/threonine protein kinase fused to TPR repeats domain|uniref:Protein kinase n=1 Tax=Flavonifractor plautii TaxID=292800 RepID=A0AAW6CC71_FLAPL|nr:serine/threonine-protein kinase [Flavonifractor plautii]MDB7927379.1 protein kinase [Flavonifractor plautii]MDB7932136.1 protein kinase [Flavonifractor plautii]MDB7937203.1 protein kinase [Flavonifractor plautii]
MLATFNDTYEIKSIIGKGGMSTVYLAEHKRLHTRWAMKEVRKQQGTRFDFLAESNILKRLQHPMLPRIVDIFEDRDCIYIVEDFVEGITLDGLLKQQKKVDEPQGLQWLRDLCGVLTYLHGQRPHPIIYRDMKPSNIMLQPDGSLKLIDFGIAREYKQESNADTTYIGTKGYAAPEQFGKAQTDARTDIYSLGVTMYHLLTGKSPYEPPYQFVPVRQLVPELSHGIEYILNKCVQSEPADRYQTVDELVDDLDHIYRFDRAWQKYQNAKRIRVAVVAVMLAASVGLMVGGQVVMGQEKEAAYSSLLAQASELYTTDYDGMVALLDEARTLYPERMDADRQQTYALYLNGKWQDCIDFGSDALQNYGEDIQIRLSMASAQFELGEYEDAAEGFAQGGELSVDNLRDYAVCLGRLGEIDQAEQILDELIGQGAHPDVTQYVQGEVYFAQEDYLDAETAFLDALDQSETSALTRRCYVSLGDLYRDCAALMRVNASPIEYPATKSAELLSSAVVQEGLRYDSVLWEMLALAYFEAYHTDASVPQNYLTKAAECFNRVIELGVTKEYLYSNLYTIYYELKDYAKAEQALTAYEEMFPEDYMPHALRGMMLITIENAKPQSSRNYRPALAEYETAGSMIRSSDETTYYQQLGSLIENLRRNGWL